METKIEVFAQKNAMYFYCYQVFDGLWTPGIYVFVQEMNYANPRSIKGSLCCRGASAVCLTRDVQYQYI